MHYAFQDKENLYLAMDLKSGGDLRFHIARKRRFSEPETSIMTEFKVVNRIFYWMHIIGFAVHP